MLYIPCVEFQFCSGALRTGSRASEAILWQNLNQLYDK